MPKDLDLDDVVKLMKCCKMHGVTKLVWGDLRLEQGSSEAIQKVRKSSKALAREKEALESEARSTQKERLEHLMIENPIEYEKLLAQDALEDDESGNDEE